MRAIEVYQSSDGEVTKAYYAALSAKWRIGPIAMNLFRAQKASARAKVYRGGIRGQGSYRSMAYERKGWALEQVCTALTESADLGIPFGWQQDRETPLGGRASWILYAELPSGQVSFHSPTRYAGPDYNGAWDGQHLSLCRILVFCDAVMDSCTVDVLESIELHTWETRVNGIQAAVPARRMQRNNRSKHPSRKFCSDACRQKDGREMRKLKPPRLCDECRKRLRKGEGLDHADHDSTTQGAADAIQPACAP